MLRLLALLLAVAFASPAVAADAAQFRIQLSSPILVSEPVPVQPTAADTRPTGYDRAGLAEEFRWFGDDQRVLDLLRNNSATESAINWPDAAPQGSQRLEIRFLVPTVADGCTVTLQSRGAPALPGVQFQARLPNGSWTAWSEAVGGWDAKKSGNKTYTGDCGLNGAPILALAVRPSANGTTGAIWYREFRISLAGVSAP